jgi:hypothetical protein
MIMDLRDDLSYKNILKLKKCLFLEQATSPLPFSSYKIHRY